MADDENSKNLRCQEPNHSLSVKGALEYGWRTIQAYPRVTISYVVALLIINYLYGFGSLYVVRYDSENWAFVKIGVLFILYLTVSVYIFMALLKDAIAIGRNHVDDGLFVSLPTGGEFLKYVLFIALIFSIICAGLVLLIIPGVYWALKYSQAFWLFLERPQEISYRLAMRTSAILTEPRGVKMRILSIYLVSGLIFAISGKVVAAFDTLLMAFISDLIQHFGSVFDVFVAWYVYMELSHPPSDCSPDNVMYLSVRQLIHGDVSGG